MSGGFYKAPVSKVLCSTVLSSTVLLSASWRTRAGLDIAAVLSKGEMWRLLTSHLPFSTSSELVLGMMLLYKFRVFERLLGSDKFGAFVFFVTSLSTSLQAGLAVTLSPQAQPAMGPYSLIYAMFVLYHSWIPVTQPRTFGLLGVDFSNKAWCFAAGAPLLFSQGLRSVLPGLCGVFAGWVYVNDVSSVQSFRLPSAITKVLRLLAPVIADGPPRSPRPRSQRRPADDGRGFPAAASLPQVPIQPPSEDDITTLMSMGFDREPARRALERSGNNVQVAADHLLSGAT